MTMSTKLEIRMTVSEKRRIKKAASRVKMEASTWARELLVRRAAVT